jgi:hypothetical protein
VFRTWVVSFVIPEETTGLACAGVVRLFYRECGTSKVEGKRGVTGRKIDGHRCRVPKGALPERLEWQFWFRRMVVGGRERCNVGLCAKTADVSSNGVANAFMRATPSLSRGLDVELRSNRESKVGYFS